MSLRFFARFLAPLLLALGLISSAWAAPAPTAEQIEAFKKLSPEEQQSLAAQFGVNLGGTTRVVAPKSTAPAPTASAPSGPTPPPPPAPRATPTPDLNAPVETVAPAATPDKAKLAEPQEAQGTTEKLKPFGYSLFAGSPSTFAPATDIPVPLNYVIGPGDSILVQLYGKQSANYELIVDREGMIRFPDLGPMNAAGQEFDAFKVQLNNTISEKMIGVKASITMGALRSIRIFVMGEAFRPGSYTVSSLSTITNALFASGGVTPIGSLRAIELKRKGETIATIDLYDLLLKGDSKDDQRLLPGDVIFVPPVGKTVGVAGEVRRPAIYELKDETTFKDVVTLAGGELPTAYPDGSRVERIDDAGNRTIVDISLTNKKLKPTDGDVLTVASILEKMENVVLVSGHVQRPGGYQWRKGLRVSDLVRGVSTLLPKPDLRYALIKREVHPTRQIEVLQFSLEEVFARPGKDGDPLLKNRDEIIILGKYSQERLKIISPVTDQLKAQAAYGQPAPLVTIVGNVNFEGTYPLTRDLRVSDLVAIGDLGPQPDLNYALIRREKQPTRDVEVFSVPLVATPSTKDIESDPLLAAGDTLYVFSLAIDDRSEPLKPLLSQLQRQAGPGAPNPVVTVTGDVRFPGSYPLTGFMKVKDLIAAAGGFTESAYGISAEISRTIISDTQFATFNRIDIEFGSQNRRVSDENLLLISRDQLYIKRVPNWNEQEYAEVLGEVNFPGRYPIYKEDTLRELVKRAGGLSTHANPKGAVFLREELRQREQDQLMRLREQLSRDLAAMNIENSKQKVAGIETAAVGSNLLDQATAAKATGRLSINLPDVLSGKRESLIGLRNGDRLIIPRPADEVTVMGEVQYPASHIHRTGMSVSDYIGLSGGTTDRSDEDRTYVIKANGEIIASSKFLGMTWQNTTIEAGDAIVVPYDVYQVSPLTYWSTVSQLLFNLSATAAALKTVGVYQ